MVMLDTLYEASQNLTVNLYLQIKMRRDIYYIVDFLSTVAKMSPEKVNSPEN